MGEIWNWTPSMEGKKRPKKGADQSKLVGNTGVYIWGSLYVREFTLEQGNLHLRLVLYSSKVSRSLSPPARILKSLHRTLTEFIRVFILDDLNNTWFSQGYTCENSSFFGMVSRVGEEVRILWLPSFGATGSFGVNWQSHPLDNLSVWNQWQGYSYHLGLLVLFQP